MIHTRPHCNIVYISPLLPVSVSQPIVFFRSTPVAAAPLIILSVARRGGKCSSRGSKKRQREAAVQGDDWKRFLRDRLQSQSRVVTACFLFSRSEVRSAHAVGMFFDCLVLRAFPSPLARSCAIHPAGTRAEPVSPRIFSLCRPNFDSTS